MVVNLGFLGLGPHVKTLAKARDETDQGEKFFQQKWGETETSPKKEVTIFGYVNFLALKSPFCKHFSFFFACDFSSDSKRLYLSSSHTIYHW